MAQSRTLYVGRDVQTESSAVAYVAQDPGAAVVSRGPVGTRHGEIDQLIRQLQAKRTQRVFVSAAGPCGSGRYRYLTKQGSPGWVVAPSWIPTKTGARGQTDRRDARQLARLMRAGDLTPVYVPAVDEAARRDLSRARAATLRELQAAPLRLNAFVLRHDSRSPGRANWRPAHLRWLSKGGCPTPAQHIVVPEYVQTVTAPTERLGRLELALHEPGHRWRVSPVVEALQALRGVQGTVAVTTGAALGARMRFDPPRQLRHALGRTPSADSSGARRQQGGIPQTGHPQARRALGEGAWAYRDPAKVSRHVHRRLAKRPKAMQASSWQAQVRLCTRDRQRMAQGHNATQVVVAMARELVGFMGALAQQVPGPPKAERWRGVAISCRGCQRLSAEAQPRVGVTLGGVQRPTGMLVPRMRQAPDGGQEGGSPPTNISVINRRVLLAPALPRDKRETTMLRT